MNPIDRRVTAARLLALRDSPGATAAIADLLGVTGMPVRLAERSRKEIAAFVASGDAVAAAQLIHAAMVRRRATTTSTADTPRRASLPHPP